MADNYLPPINLDFGGLTLPKPGEVPSEAYRRLQGDGSIPPGTPREVVDMLDDTGGDPALDPPQVFSDKNASQLKHAPDPADPLAVYDFTKQPSPEAMAPAWAMKGPDVSPEQRKRNAGQFDPTLLDNLASEAGVLGLGRMSPSESQQEQDQRQKDLEAARKTVTDQILFQGSQALDGPVEQPPVNQSVLDQNVSNAAPVKQKQKVADQAPPNLAKWRDFTERSLQSFLTGLVALPRGAAIAADLPRAIGATIRGNKNLDQNAAAEKLQKVTDDIQAALPGDRARSAELVSQIGTGSGSMGAFLVGGAAAKALGLSVKAGAAVTGAAVGGVQGFDDARAYDAPTAARYLSFVAGSALGTTEAIPIDRALYWLNRTSGGTVGRIISRSAVNGIEELIQEVGQQVGQNLTAKILYDHSREIFDGVADAGTVAFVIGSMFGLGAQASRAVNNRLGLKSPQEAQEAPPTGSEAPTQPAGAENPPAGQISQPGGARPAIPPEHIQQILPAGVPDLFSLTGKTGALVTGVPDPGGDVSAIVRAYHGSPHTFDKFSLDKIGTGEGAQAYGHGLYFAESEGVARSYRDALSAPTGEKPEDIAGRVYEAVSGDRDRAIAELQRRVDSIERRRAEDPSSVPTDMLSGETSVHKALAYLKNGGTPGGALYEVQIDANPDDFLDWDKPLSQQPKVLRDYLAKADLSHLPEGGRLRRTIEAYRGNPGDWVPPPGANIPEPLGHQIYDALTEYGGGAARNAALTKAMSEAGILGIKYLDAGSRGKGDGTRNYVVFDENRVKIVKRNGEDVPGDISAMQSPQLPRPSYPLERQRPTADGAGYFVRMPDGSETVMGANAVDVSQVEVGSSAQVETGVSAQTQPIADQTQTDEFRRWFGESKVVDDQGKPLVVYHGTPGPAFKIFDNAKTGITTFIGVPIETHRQGFYFAEKKGFAQGFADQTRGRQRGAVMDVYLNIRNPLDVTSTDNASVARLEKVAERMREIDPAFNVDYIAGKAGYDSFWELLDTSEGGDVLVQAAKDLGYDGIKMIEPDLETSDPNYAPNGNGAVTWVSFNPTQIKSATGNSGAFDGSNPDITAMRSPQRPAPAYPLERTRPATGIPEQQNVAPAEQTASKRDIADRFKDAINLVVKQGRFGKANSKAEAIYKWGQSVARVKSQGQLLELFHEGGHHLHATLEPLLDPVIAKHDAEILKIADTLYGGGGQIDLKDVPLRRKEGFATFFQVYMNNPAEARVIAPAFLPEFEAVLEQDRPGIKSELEAIRKDVDAWLLSKSSAQLARERVVSGKPLGTVAKIVQSIKDGTVLHDVATLSNRVYQATLDENHPLTLAVRRLKAVAEENIRTQIERGLLAKDQALAALAKLDRRGRSNPVKMAVLARNAYHASSEMIASGIAKYNGDGSAVSKGLTEILHKAMGGKRLDAAVYQDFNTYLAMRRIIAEWQNYYATLKWDHAKNYGPASNNAQEPPVKRFRRPDDVSLGDAQQAMADLIKANPQFAEAAGELYVYLDELLQYKVDAGIISQKTADAQRQVADYVPLRREMDDTKSGTLGKSKDARTGKDNLIRVFRGSDRRILSPVESIMQMTHETVALVAKNDVKRSLVQMALDVGRGSGAVVEQIPASQMKGTSVNLAEVLKAAGDFSLAEEIAEAMGRDEITMQEFMDEVLDGDEAGTIWRKADITEKGEPIVYTWRNGEVEAYQLNDAEWADDLYNSLTELGKEQTNLAIQILGKPAAALRAGVTTSPPFLIANLVRDQLGAWVLNDGVYPVAGLAKGLASDLFDRKARRLYNLSMASIGGSNVAALDKTRFGTEQTMLAKAGVGVTVEQSLNTALRVLDSTETFSRQGIWQAAFKKAQADGLSVADAMIEAGYEASDYANYGRAGSKMLLARRLVTFLNANLQGLDKSLRVALGGEAGGAFLRKQLAPWVRRQISPAAASRIGLEGSQTSLPLTVQEKQQLARAGRTLSKMMMLAIPSMLLAMLYRDDEEYQDFSPYLKGTRWMVKIAPGKWLAIPKPFQLATFATFVEYSSDAILHGDPTAMQKFMQSQAAVIAPPYENPAIKQFYELATNTDMFSGRPIVSPAVGARPAWLQYDEYTSEFGKAMGRFTGASPMIVDHVITSSFATWGRGFLSASNLLNPDRPAQGLDDFAFTSYFVKDGSRSSTVRPAFLDLVGQTQGKLTGAYSGYKALMDGGADGQAKDLLDNLAENQKVFALLYYHQEADAKKLHPLRNAYDIVQTISGLRKELVVNRVREGGKDDGEIITLSPTQQKLLNDRLSDLQVRVQRNALVATGEPGFANRKILPTFPLVEEIKAIDPRIAADLKTRMGSRIYTTDTVAKLWPKVQAELLANGPKANLRPFVMRAKAAGNKIWTNGGTE